MFISSRFFENQPNEICSHLSEKASKGRLFGPDKLQNNTNEGKRKGEKERARRNKGGEEKKAMVAHLVSYNGYFRGSFWPFGNPARYILITNEDT